MMQNKKFIYLYYLVLLLILASRQNANSEPSMVLRLAFLGALVIPCMVSNVMSYSAIITIFYSITLYGFAYSYMPYMIYIYVILTLVVLIWSFFINRKLSSPPIFLILFALYIFIIDLLNGYGKEGAHLFENNFYCFLIIIIFLQLIGEDHEKNLSQFSLGFAIIAITLSVFFLFNRERFASNYGLSGLERQGWTDPNYFGMVLGMGTIVGLLKLLSGNRKEVSLLEKVIYIISIAISIPVLIMNASRGAILSVIVAFGVLMMFSKAKMGFKIIITIIALVFIYFLYTNQYFELLEYRMLEEDGTGSDRTNIWASKMQAYFQNDVFHLIFGSGYYNGLRITGKLVGFHNDIIAFVVEYGILGLCFLIYMFYYPFKLLPLRSKYKPAVFTIFSYLFFCLFTLEPLSGGHFSFYPIYFYLLLLAINARRVKTV